MSIHMKRSLLAALIVLSSNGSPIFAQSVEELLNEADRALNPSQKASPDKSTAPEEEAKDAPRKRRSIAKPKTAEEQKPEEPVKHTAVEAGSLKEILSLDKEREKRDKKRKLATQVSLAFGASYFMQHPGYELEKDEDRFTYTDPEPATGAYLGIQGRNPSDTFSADWIYGLNAGYVSSSSTVQRRGIEDDKRSYHYTLIPLDVLFGMGKGFWDRFYADFSVGIAGEFINQQGSSDSDSISTVLFGPSLSTGISYHVTEALDALLRYQRHGIQSKSNGGSIASSQVVCGLQWQIAM